MSAFYLQLFSLLSACICDSIRYNLIIKSYLQQNCSQVFDGLVEFVTNTVERTYTEKVRGEARRKWSAQILASAETGGASMEHVYRAVFQTLRKVISSSFVI